jgi:putative protease
VKKPELLAPGGSFAAAYQAFEAGADGVYLGLTEFSARRAAANFSFEQLRRIRALAGQRGRRIYVTVNTVIRQDEMERLATVFSWLDALEVDGVIVQDLGACRLLARGFPRLAIHASTQMAIHNDAGLRFAKEQGIRRVILSRELPFQRIRDLRLRHPGLELEVFIHGALCYSFSGVCLASSALTGRSGNRGECAQICRSVFCGATPFSCRDLWLGRDVLKLAQIGIDSLKIEGRMKSPEYVFHVTRLYREILDKGESLSDGELEELQKNVERVFSREKTKAYFESFRGEKLLTSRYPGHQGVPLGNVTDARGREIGLRLLTRLSLHDGAGHWPDGAVDPAIFPIRAITRAGKVARFAEAGESVFIPVPLDVPMPARGAEVRLFSSRFLDRPQPKESSVPAFRLPLRIKFILREENGSLVISCTAGSGEGKLDFSSPVSLVPSTGRKSFETVLRDLMEGSGGLHVVLEKPEVMNESGRADDEIFVPPSELKRVRKEITAALDSWFPQSIEDRAHAALAAEASAAGATAATTWAKGGDRFSQQDLPRLSHRDLLSPPAGLPVPFVSLPALRAGLSGLASVGGFVFLPLPPVNLDDDELMETLEALVSGHPGIRFAIGLNNVGHLDLAGRLSERENCFFFVDFYLYVANGIALSFLTSRVKKLLFLYHWIEGDETNLRAVALETRADESPGSESPAFVRIDPHYRPPLFYSLGCFERHAQGRGRCPEGCPKDFMHELRQGKSSFRVVVRDCVTYLFQKEAAHGSSI